MLWAEVVLELPRLLTLVLSTIFIFPKKNRKTRERLHVSFSDRLYSSAQLSKGFAASQSGLFRIRRKRKPGFSPKEQICSQIDVSPLQSLFGLWR